MGHEHDERDVIVIERGGGVFGPVLFGALLGLAAGLLFAPRSGAETRRALASRLGKARELAEGALERVGEEVRERITAEGPSRAERRDAARGDLERRMAEARARRRRAAGEDAGDEPVG